MSFLTGYGHLRHVPSIMQLRLSFVLLGLAVATYARPINYALQARSEVTPSTPYRTPTVHADSATLNRRVVTSTAAVEGSSPTSTVFPTGSNVSGTPTQGTSHGGLPPSATPQVLPVAGSKTSDSMPLSKRLFDGVANLMQEGADKAKDLEQKKDDKENQIKNGAHNIVDGAVSGVKNVAGGFAGAAGGLVDGAKKGYEAGANANSQPPPPNNV
ncbi:hypothetical protein EV360DRAFT_84159 [Lentinula raphanica]|nr:hypothetical protein EV360DRAFT_84159 [Lentinula raphanica]